MRFISRQSVIRMRYAGLLAAAAIAVLPAAAQAEGQDKSVDKQATPQPGDGDIVVTAQRDPSLASKTPVAITAISGQALASKGVNDPLKLANLVPNLQINRFYGLQITIRGITSSNMFAQGDPSAAFLLDGVYIARPQAQEANFFDVDRVEVLRGPQGTLYGRNTTAGVINVISVRPTTDKVKGYFNISYGNYHALQMEGAINLPVTDNFALRIAGTVDKRDSYFSNVAGDTIDANPFRYNRAVRLSAKWDPTDNLSIFVSGDYSLMTGIDQIPVDGTRYYDLTDENNPIYTGDQYSTKQLLDRGYAQQINPHVHDKIYGVTGEVSWNLGPVTATYLGSYRKFDQNEAINDLSGQVSPTYITGRFEQNSQEMRFALNDVERLKLQFGAMYFHEKSTQYFDQPDYFDVPNFILDYDPTRATSYAFFGQATYSLTDRLRLTGGVRYTHDAKDQFGWTILKYTDDFSINLLNGGQTKSHKITWRAGLDYDLNANNMVYGSIATGYKSGSFNNGCEIGTTLRGNLCTADNGGLPASDLYYKPETLIAYELGLKGHLVDHLLSYDISAFLYNYDNMQVGTVSYYSGAATSVTLNAAKARVKGVEASAVLTPTPRNKLALSVNWLDAKYLDWVVDASAGLDNSGKPLSRSPKWTGSVDYTYTLPLDNGGSLVANGRVNLSTRYFFVGTETAGMFKQPGYTRSDISLTYNAPGDHWFIQGFARNLENKVQVTSFLYFNSVLSVMPSDPRTFGVKAGIKF